MRPCTDAEAVRRWLLRLEWPGAARQWGVLGEPLASFGDALADAFRLPRPRAAIAHRDCAITWHRDTLNPYPCTNIIVVFKRGCLGGDLEIRAPEGLELFHMHDRSVIPFDGQMEHRVTPIALVRGGYRIGLTFYCPKA